MPPQGHHPRAVTVALLERSRELSTLGTFLDDAKEISRGRFVFLAGEAGIGKTSLLRRLCADCGRGTRILWGACDPMGTPQPLAPLLDLAEAAGEETAALVTAGAKPHPIATALLRDLAAPAPTLLVIEDLHWADEATLDVLGLLARRIGDRPVLVLASFRDDELDRHDPLRVLLGELATAPDVMRMPLAPLSREAVATLATPHGVDADALYEATDGNAFFVTEVLAGADERIPATVRDAVMARTARLSTGARNVLDAAAVLLPPVDLAILNAVAPHAAGELAECLGAGMLVATTGGVAFRHELSRLAVAESLSPDVRIALNSEALTAIASRPSRRVETARLAHHAEEAGDADAVLRFAPAAAREAAAVGAHREAAAQYERALRFSDGAELAVRAQLLDRRTAELTLIGEFRTAITSGREALECWQRLGDRRQEGRALTALAWPLWVLGAKDEAEATAHRAIAVLEEGPPVPELIEAYVRLSISAHGSEALDAAVTWATRGLAVAEQLDDEASKIACRVEILGAECVRQLPGAHEDLEQVLAVARDKGLEHAAAYAYCYLAAAWMRKPDYVRAASSADDGIVYCTEHDLYGFRPYLVGVRSHSELARGRWADAADSAAAVLAGHGAGLGTILANAALGRVRARRGDPATWEPLDEALRLSDPSGEIQRLSWVAAARAEAAWLEGRFDVCIQETELTLELARRTDAWVVLGELAVWRRRAGLDEPAPADAAEPYASELAGDWYSAAAQWTALGAPYEAALALADGDDEDALRQALDELQRLGAAPAAAIVARRLRSRGARGLPRGPRARTCANPANLTPREMEILALVAEGRRNNDIAERLFLSQKTVSHHVSAILRKLEVKTRGEAGAAAVRLGLLPDDA
jgi:DNA-binding CsgD family transcriptional regulator/tetratricopeptide (TPR) repeat protein